MTHSISELYLQCARVYYGNNMQADVVLPHKKDLILLRTVQNLERIESIRIHGPNVKKSGLELVQCIGFYA